MIKALRIHERLVRTTRRHLALVSGLMLLGIFLGSCTSEPSQKDYFVSQQRDSRLTGIWVLIDPRTNEMTEYEDEYIGCTGELIHLNLEKTSRIRKEYYYTVGNHLHTLTLGDKGKVAERTHQMEYRLSQDGRYLYLKELNASDSEIMTWKRKTTSK